jgi:CBS domain-containing protein
MPYDYQPLPLHRLESGTRFFYPKQPLASRVTISDSAVAVLTDFNQVTPLTVDRSTPLEKSLEIMIKHRVRLLLVCTTNGNIIGLLTSRDISGDKPQRILAKSGGTREELVVADVMTLRPKLDTLMLADVVQARVGDIIETLKQAKRQHALVLDNDSETGEPMVRGIFSLSQIGLQLGLNIDVSQRPTTYTELMRAGYVL